MTTPPLLFFLFFVPLFHALPPLECVTNSLASLAFMGRVNANPASEEFQNTTDIDNGRCRVTPLILVFPSSTKDVAIALKTAQSCNISFSVLGGGHGAGGYGLVAQGLTISMSDMKQVTVDAGVGKATMQAGVIFKELYLAAQNTGWTPVGGGCPYVGVGGFYQGGGWSFLSRSYGMAIDTLLSFEIVLADGRALTVDTSNTCQLDPTCRDLWWAVRGGGGGNFGVVTQYTAQMAKLPPEIFVGQLCWAEDTKLLPRVWQWLLDAYKGMPNWIQIDPGWLPLGTNGSRLFCHTVICNNGNVSACQEFVQPAVDIGEVAYVDMQTQAYLTWQIHHDSITSAQHGNLYLTNVMMDPGVVSSDVMVKLQQAVLSAPSSRNLIIFHLGGGQIMRVGSNETAFPHRNSQFVLQIKAIWGTNSTVDADENIKWVESLKAWLDPLSTGSYVNYIDPFLDNWETKYYTVNLPRLQQVKKAVDPTNLFHFNQSIRLPVKREL